MRKPFKFIRTKLEDTRKEFVDSGVQSAIESTKDKVQSHLKENWTTYAINGVVFFSGVTAGTMLKNSKTVHTTINNNVIYAQTVIVKQQ